MASNKFFTIMIVPEKTQKVRRIVVPHYVFNGAILSVVFLGVLATIMILDYANVMNQISENKQLKVENRQLRQSIQVFKNKMVTIESTMDRVKTFVTKLRIITNIERTAPILNPPQIAPALPMPEAVPAPSVPPPQADGSQAPQKKKIDTTKLDLEKDTDEEATHPMTQKYSVLDPDADTDVSEENSSRLFERDSERARRKALVAALMGQTSELPELNMSDLIKTEFEKLDIAYDSIYKFTVEQEQDAQDLLERLGEKRTILASTPTLLPTNGYITSEYGVRISPYDGRRKMHEGLDIANRYGSDITTPADGMIVFSGVKPGYGKMVVIDHGNGIETRYAHNSKMFVVEGQQVKRGQRIASVGNSGHSTGPHVHYEVHAGGLPVDPCWYIVDQPGLCRDR